MGILDEFIRGVFEMYRELFFSLLAFVIIIGLLLWKRGKEFGTGWRESEGKKVAIKNKELCCSHCGGKNFRKLEGKITTSLMMLFQLGWLNRSAVCFSCIQCGLVLWFLSPKEKVFREFDRDEF